MGGGFGDKKKWKSAQKPNLAKPVMPAKRKQGEVLGSQDVGK